MTYADLLPLYYPPISYDVRATHQAAERRAEAAIFDGVQTQSAQVLAAAYAPLLAATSHAGSACSASIRRSPTTTPTA